MQTKNAKVLQVKGSPIRFYVVSEKQIRKHLLLRERDHSWMGKRLGRPLMYQVCRGHSRGCTLRGKRTEGQLSELDYRALWEQSEMFHHKCICTVEVLFSEYFLITGQFGKVQRIKTNVIVAKDILIMVSYLFVMVQFLRCFSIFLHLVHSAAL